MQRRARLSDCEMREAKEYLTKPIDMKHIYRVFDEHLFNQTKESLPKRPEHLEEPFKYVTREF
jgi:hypothetical protein